MIVCPDCKTISQEGNFCTQCGCNLCIKCETCGVLHRSDKIHCHSCGHLHEPNVKYCPNTSQDMIKASEEFPDLVEAEKQRRILML